MFPNRPFSNAKWKSQLHAPCRSRSQFLYWQGLADLVPCLFYLLLVGPFVRLPRIAKEHYTWFQISKVFLSVLFLAFKTDTVLGLSQGAEKDVTRLHWLFDFSFLACWLVEY